MGLNMCLFLGIRCAPRSTLFPYTTLFRSLIAEIVAPRLWFAPETIDGAYTSNDPKARKYAIDRRSEEHTSELQSRLHLVCRLLLEKKNQQEQVYGVKYEGVAGD